MQTVKALSLLSLAVLGVLLLSWPVETPVRSASLEEQASGLELVGQSGLGSGSHGDIWVHGQFAYLGTDSCGIGVKVVDVSDPTNPQLVGSLLSSAGSTYEDVVVTTASTPAFQGDLLAAGLQVCGPRGAHGVQFWDVTDPRQPRRLGFLDTGANTGGVHELYLFQRDHRVFALLAVPGSEAQGAGGDFRLVEATDPRAPRQLAAWGVGAGLGLELTNGIFCHSAWANDAGTLAYLSYWDAGVIILDISDPGQPRFVGRTTYAPGEEGNAHSVWPANGGTLLLVADEDFSPGGAHLMVTDPPALAGPIPAVEGSITTFVCALGDLSGEVAYVGQGCNNNAYAANPRGKIALIDRGSCTFSEKILRAQAAGAVAVVVANNTPGPPLTMGGDPSGIHIAGVMISQADGARLKAALSGGQTVRLSLTPDPQAGWGFLRLFDLRDPTQPRQISTFATNLTRQCPPPDGGWYTIHNPFVVGDTAYLSWYSDGVRVLDISDPTQPREIAFFVPPDRSDGQGLRGGKALVWGVYVQDDLIYLSDINTGLYILRRN